LGIKGFDGFGEEAMEREREEDQDNGLDWKLKTLVHKIQPNTWFKLKYEYMHS
jgi:hypothetical protein